MWLLEGVYKKWRRDQDRMIEGHVQNGRLVGVFDGHGDSNDAVELCKKRFPQLLGNADEQDAKKMLEEAFEEMAEGTRLCTGGSTATIALLWESGVVNAAILGDSPIVVYSGGHASLGPIHNVGSNSEEREAAIKRGGHYQYPYIGSPKSYWGVQLSRSFEHQTKRPIVSVTPELKDFMVKPGGWVAVMSDGVLDSLVGDLAADVKEFVALVEDRRLPHEIVKIFQSRKGDDASLIIARFT